MALLPLPRRTRIAHLSDHHVIRDMRDGLPDLPLPDFSDLVEAVIEVGAKHRPAMLAPHKRPSRRRPVALVVFVLAVGALALAYRWWRGRDKDTARLIDVPAGPDRTPAAPSWTPSPSATPQVDANDAPPASPRQDEMPPEAARAEAPRETAAEPDRSSAPATPDSVTETVSTPSSMWAPRTQPRPQSPVASAPVRPQWKFGRGPSTAVPPVPAGRPALPGRPHSHLPR